ncbi:hypothetical protein [Pontibacillus yanchengensis]|uniref:Uncharacterized protein n=1 Tax=Pontibacillus yanchengensis Y32 TaxID=1385514 RepID=A0A0A2TGQ6_9BACI|nr:hypothetical protein [Pontibacillus yanchengensis]KGP73608.1 hypothetical protein N782_03970 [Pontibacillus yanchengensis Y32]
MAGLIFFGSTLAVAPINSNAAGASVGGPSTQWEPLPRDYDYIHTDYIHNHELPALIDEVKKTATVSGAGAASLAFFKQVGTFASGSVAVASFLVGSGAESRADMYQQAYHAGKDIQYFVRYNPDYNGYNNRHDVDWIFTNTLYK